MFGTSSAFEKYLKFLNMCRFDKYFCFMLTKNHLFNKAFFK